MTIAEFAFKTQLMMKLFNLRGTEEQTTPYAISTDWKLYLLFYKEFIILYNMLLLHLEVFPRCNVLIKPYFTLYKMQHFTIKAEGL